MPSPPTTSLPRSIRSRGTATFSRTSMLYTCEKSISLVVLLRWDCIVCFCCSPPGGTFDQQGEDVEALGSPLLPLLVLASIQLPRPQAPPSILPTSAAPLCCSEPCLPASSPSTTPSSAQSRRAAVQSDSACLQPPLHCSVASLASCCHQPHLVVVSG